MEKKRRRREREAAKYINESTKVCSLRVAGGDVLLGNDAANKDTEGGGRER